MLRLTDIWWFLLVLVVWEITFAAALPTSPKQINGTEYAQVLRAMPLNHEDLILLKSMTMNFLYDFWLEPRGIGSPVDIMARNNILVHLRHQLDTKGVFYFVLIDEVDTAANTHQKENNIARAAKPLNKVTCDISWDAYHTYSELEHWLQCLEAKYPMQLTLIKVGRSYERRPMYAVKLSKPFAWFKPVVWIDGGVHGREWISPAVVTYMLKELLQNPAYDYILDFVNFYFVPVMNPDGYVYTFTDGGRFWEKTRSKQNSMRTCLGVDLNRNWSFKWNKTIFDYPCSETYPGEAPFSEKELLLIRPVIMSNVFNIKAYLSYHSYSQLWLYPWGYTTEKAPNYVELETLSASAVSAIYSYNQTRYRQQPKCIQQEMCESGSSIDWMKGSAKTKYPFQIMLPDLGNYGYLLPPTDIVPIGEESLKGLLVIAEAVGTRTAENEH